MSDFKVKMHQIWFRLGLRPRHLWGSLHRSLRSLAAPVYKYAPFRWVCIRAGNSQFESIRIDLAERIE